MVRVFRRDTGKEVTFDDRRSFSSVVYAPIMTVYQVVYSKIIQEAIEYYKDVPLTEHVMTDGEKRKVEKNPDAINDIPKWEIKGYDEFVSNERLDRRISTEFYARFMTGDKKIVEIINNYHPILKAM